MRGFEYETHKKLQGIYPTIFIKAPEGSSLSLKSLQTFLHTTLKKEVQSSAPYILKNALLHPATTHHPLLLVSLKGIDPEREKNVTNLAHMIQSPAKLSDVKGQNIMVGKSVAQQMDVIPGQQAVLLCNQQDNDDFSESATLSVPVTIAGIISTGIADYDEHLVLLSLDLCKKIWGNECITHMGIQLKNDSFESTALETLKKLPDLEVFSWKDCYPALVSALRLEKYAMFFILLLIALVACMNIISLLFMFIAHKQTDIALLKMLGLQDRYIYTLFLFVGLSIAAITSFLGLIAAFAVGYFLQIYPCITLPDVYYVTHLPVTLEPTIFILIFLSVLVLTFVACLLPLRSLSHLNITKTLRFE